MSSSDELTQREKHLIKMRQKFSTRRQDIIAYMLKRPQGTSIMELAQGLGMSLASIERYVAKMKRAGDIELCRSEPIKGVSRRPINYYVVTIDGELDGLSTKSY
jgi:predicted ArsR family transcriptional regulator